MDTIVLIKKSELNLLDTYLECVLDESKIEYTVAYVSKPYGMNPPVLLVNGVPLDMARALKYLKERGNK